jgi:hypothetical protein
MYYCSIGYTDELQAELTLQQLRHTLNIPVCFAFVSRCLLALRTMEIPSLLYCLESESKFYVTIDGQ